MKIKITVIIALLFYAVQAKAQVEPVKRDTLKEVIITSTRIDLPFKKNSRTINVISSEEIKNSAATNVADLLQQVAGVDIRRRGTAGSQADLYIRGGGFDQTLLLIDGIKMDDSQTGHHTLNAVLPVEVIERIEVIKGPAARVFGQNAFTGAINIVTKNKLNNLVSVNVEAGSFGQLNGSVTIGKEFENSSVMAHVGILTSDGYRHNSDYNNKNYFIKGIFNKKEQPIEVIATFFDKKFGANGFYASATATEQYEETQSSLLGASTTFKTENFKITPRVYWKRGQDDYVYIRDNPSVYRNLHITNKIGVETNASYTSNLGITGFGIDISRVFISSNNLGNRNRTMVNLFLEHRFKLADDKIDITPGVAVTYFSDFKFHAFPGIDVGFKLSDNLKAYGNLGITYRIPTYTDLFYNDRTTIGNENLKSEEAFSQEIGLKYDTEILTTSVAFFNRDADNLIDFIRSDLTSKYAATNIPKFNTKGFEFNADYRFKINEFNQTLSFGYNFLDDNFTEEKKEFSRYSLSTLKHQFITRFASKLFKNVRQNIIYKYAERTVGTSYNVWDASVIVDFNQLSFTVTASNIFDADYIETGYVPMPPSNVLFGFRYSF
ncbi:iron complex outermembrane recepter protein [Polaribacter sp. KT25b]|uniref:TonB-dependent receptor plug domain-containing protein n=1 Tax=Polaribacter sp. KT25b TaxID=1855336 RepID=UPI00087CAC48|nr:TonB-dependent receptor [Polaribacter sp. KT25b]SDS33402.1 iron complex outermembrane recepter protein [Polaribacter sp. KT25b]